MNKRIDTGEALDAATDALREAQRKRRARALQLYEEETSPGKHRAMREVAEMMGVSKQRIQMMVERAREERDAG